MLISSMKAGINEKVRGKYVDVIRHPRFPQLYQFEYDGDMYICSNYAFADLTEDYDGDMEAAYDESGKFIGFRTVDRKAENK